MGLVEQCTDAVAARLRITEHRFHPGRALIDTSSQGIGVAQEQQRQPSEHCMHEGMPRRVHRVLLRLQRLCPTQPHTLRRKLTLVLRQDVHAAAYPYMWIKTLVSCQCFGIDTGAIRETPGVARYRGSDAPLCHRGADPPARYIISLSRLHEHAAALRDDTLYTPCAMLVSIDSSLKTVTESPFWSPSAQETSIEGMHHRHRRLIGTQRRAAVWSTFLGDPCPGGCMARNRLRLG
jgi:hypothetical protein